jgi:uncharacterized NAD(P)/FAD-binding protein YdhS
MDRMPHGQWAKPNTRAMTMQSQRGDRAVIRCRCHWNATGTRLHSYQGCRRLGRLRSLRVMSMPSRSRTIVIIGGGFCGTVLAANLLRSPTGIPTRIVLIERRAQLGRGVAYASGTFPFLLNVPAGRMSASSDDPSQLVSFARSRFPEVDADTYLPRQLYGEYLQHMLSEAVQAAPRQVQLERVHDEATAIRPIERTGPVIVEAGKRRWLADQVVFACGDPPSVCRAYATDIAAHPAYVRDPHEGECVRTSDNVVLFIGTGLTMVDVAVAAVANNPSVRLIALSRHGLLPAAQTGAAPQVLNAGLDLHSHFDRASLRQLFAGVRSLTQIVEQRGGDWREVFMRMRDVAPRLWRNLSDIERSRFMRHARVYWDVHRHRMPPAVAAQLASLQRSGQLQVRAGCVQQLCADNHRIAALWRPRGRLDTQELWIDRVVDCSGADRRLGHTTDILLRHLLDTGLASPDAQGFGVRTGQHGVLVNADGQSDARLLYLGPMLRADHWEATAVGELRAHAENLAAVLSKAQVLRQRQSAAPDLIRAESPKALGGG